MAPILWWKGGAYIARQRIEQRPPRGVEGARALNLAPEVDIVLLGIYDGLSPCRLSNGEMHQVEAVECTETKVRDKQIDRTVREGGTGFGKLRYAPHLDQIGNALVESPPEPSVRLDK